eukprot:8303120-Alexandrium_andersonii.AAC.1
MCACLATVFLRVEHMRVQSVAKCELSLRVELRMLGMCRAKAFVSRSASGLRIELAADCECVF